MNLVLHDRKLISECVDSVKDQPGDMAEIGVYKGHSALLICELATNKTPHLYDTFCGIPESELSDIDQHCAKDFKDTNLADVMSLLAGCKIEVHQGIFPATATDIGPLCFVHIDCDIYKTAKAALEWAWELLVDGGKILVDDYGAGRCVGVKRAVHEFGRYFESTNRRAIITK